MIQRTRFRMMQAVDMAATMNKVRRMKIHWPTSQLSRRIQS